ncbi:MAG TPA: DUF2085 domain-containing protein [Herpetosiphonaceae bacterium]
MSRNEAEAPPALDPASADVLARARRDIQQRRVSHAHASAQQQRSWAWAALMLSLLAIASLVLSPSGTLPTRLHALMRGVCDQVNNLPYSAPPLPLDARCTGIYASLLATLGYLLAWGRGRAAKLPSRPILGLAVAAMVMLAIDGFNSLFSQLGVHVYLPQTALRLATGLGMGAALAVVGLPLLNAGLRADADRDQPSVKDWRELSGVVVLNIIIGTLAWMAPEWLYYPLALFSFAGMISVLVLVNVGAVVLVSRRRGQVYFVGQLARPATVAIMYTIAELLLLGWARDVSAQAHAIGQIWLA